MVQVMISCPPFGVAGLFLSGFRGVPKPLFGPSTPLSALLCVLLVLGHTVHIHGTYHNRSNDRIALWRPTVADLSPSARIARMHGEGDKVSGVRLYGSHAAVWAPGRPEHVVRW